MQAKAYMTKQFQEWMTNPPTDTIRTSVAETLTHSARLIHDPYEFDWLKIRNSPEFDGFASASDTRILLIAGNEELECPDVIVLHTWDDVLGIREGLNLFKSTRFDAFLADFAPLTFPSPYLS